MNILHNFQANSSEKIAMYPRYLWLLILAYSMMVAITNWFDARLIQLFGVAFPPGSITFPVTLLLCDIITEVYGYKHARRAIWAAFFFNLLFILYGQIILLLPTPDFVGNKDVLDQFLHTNARILFAAFVSYLISEPMNSYIMAKLKVKTQGRYMGIRFMASTVVSGLIDSMMFITIAFYGLFELTHIFTLIINIWLIKILIEIIGLPFSIGAAKWLKKKEGLDIYDYDTNFIPFSVEAEYGIKNNYYHKEKKSE